jgi:Transposase DDE domain group 1
MLAGADSIDNMNVLRAGSTGLILGHRVMAPSTLGTFLRAFTFGHVRQLDHVLDGSLARAWDAGAGPGGLPLVIDIDSFIGEVHGDHKQGAGYGYTRQLGYHPIIAVRADTGEVLHMRNRTGKANTQRGAVRFVDELLARVRRAGQIVIRADSGFENHRLMKALDARGIEFSIRVKQSQAIRALIAQIPETDWVTIIDYPDTGEAQIAETQLGTWPLIVRRTRLVGAQAELFPDWRHHAFATNRTVPILIADIDHRAPRHNRARDPRSQRPSPRALPLRPVRREQRVDGDRGARPQPRTVGNPDRAPRPARPDRPVPTPPPPPDPRPPDTHQPPMDPTDAVPLALATPVHHRPEHAPSASRPSPDHAPSRDEDQPTRSRPGAITPARKPGQQPPVPTPTPPRAPNRHQHPPRTPSPHQSRQIHLTHPAVRSFQA